MRSLLAYRDYVSYTGGHGKFLDYLAHVQAHPGWQVRLYLSARSRRGPDNPFLQAVPLANAWRPEEADALLLGGMDWSMLDAAAARTGQPVINLVQGVRHADAGSALRGFLPRRAVRVCVSTAVAQAIAATGEVNGPLRVIPAAVDAGRLARLGASPPAQRILVDAVKQPALGREVQSRLQAVGVSAAVLYQRLPRQAYLQALASAAVVVALPEAAEGFYLPGLETLALGRALVQYDCRGSRDYLRDGANALVPAPSADAVAAAALRLDADSALRDRLRHAGLVTAQRFDLSVERRQVHALLDELDELWRS